MFIKNIFVYIAIPSENVFTPQTDGSKLSAAVGS